MTHASKPQHCTRTLLSCKLHTLTVSISGDGGKPTRTHVNPFKLWLLSQCHKPPSLLWVRNEFIPRAREEEDFIRIITLLVVIMTACGSKTNRMPACQHVGWTFLTDMPCNFNGRKWAFKQLLFWHSICV